ncbi:uncharacterized protein GGS22DRAFT_189660 [Annulohypoxylon maeteangense]|uniref:uncharacterized protein n=1 Tax=Annulohypoxylon maeteangense TaxID=1927788 RepID=UPI002007EA3F|nr:uncharacterized protein GGS22DRAFT_189660 [Annulohypoxylon maeteangense]KAI0883693.1 hypothetical protein GGS22DRAFT_189660 [Annulohypoxylon maeteangense]
MAPSQQEPAYTVFVRLPFPRGDFIDPPPANWDSTKDEELWNIISRPSKTEIDWNGIAIDFGVTADFLFQQIAWLTERHTSQIRAQMRKAAALAKGSSAPSPQPGPEGLFVAEPMRRTGSSERAGRAPSQLSIRKDSPLPRNDGSIPGTPVRGTPRPTATRTSSANTAVYTTRNLGGSAKPQLTSRGNDTQRQRLSSLPIPAPADNNEQEPELPSPEPTESSDSESSSSSPAQSRIIRRPPRFQDNDAASDADEDTEPAFLPYNPPSSAEGSSGHDLSATLRGNLPRDYAKRHPKGPSGRPGRMHQSQTSDSSTGSGARPTDQGRASGGPLSPRRTMELSGQSPGGKGKVQSRDSDGTPSMSSSYSDLDDTSVTRSAMEEELASMPDGTMASLRGTIGGTIGGTINLWRNSRYLPGKPNH